MQGIGGNVYAVLQVKDAGTKNAIGERVHGWSDVAAVLGWLDLSAGDSNIMNYNAKVQESTHIFICDYQELTDLQPGWLWSPFNLFTGIIKADQPGEAVSVTSENARMVVNGVVYEIMLIDDPMEMHEQLEIYLRYVGVGV